MGRIATCANLHHDYFHNYFEINFRLSHAPACVIFIIYKYVSGWLVYTPRYSDFFLTLSSTYLSR